MRRNPRNPNPPAGSKLVDQQKPHWCSTEPLSFPSLFYSLPKSHGVLRGKSLTPLPSLFHLRWLELQSLAWRKGQSSSLLRASRSLGEKCKQELFVSQKPRRAAPCCSRCCAWNQLYHAALCRCCALCRVPGRCCPCRAARALRRCTRGVAPGWVCRARTLC